MSDIPYENAPPLRVGGPGSRREIGPPLPVPTGRDVLWTFAGGLLGMLLGAVIGAVAGFALSGPAVGALLAMILAGVFGGTGLYFALVRRRRWSLSDMGFRRPAHSLFHLLWQAPLLIFAAALATAGVGELLGMAPDSDQSSIASDAAELGPVAIIAALVLIAGVVPLIEEIVFRRVFLDWLTSKMPTALAAAVVTIVFALCHIAPAVMLYIFFFGTALVVLRLWYRTLWAPLILHMTNNAVVSSIAISAVLTG